MRKQRIEVYKGLGGHGTLGLEIVLSVLIGLFGGRWADERFGTEPWLGLLGFALGVGAAVRSVQRTQRELRKVAEREERLQGNPAPLYKTTKDRFYELEERKQRLERMLLEREAGAADGVDEPEAKLDDEGGAAPREGARGDVGEGTPR